MEWVFLARTSSDSTHTSVQCPVQVSPSPCLPRPERPPSPKSLLGPESWSCAPVADHQGRDALTRLGGSHALAVEADHRGGHPADGGRPPARGSSSRSMGHRALPVANELFPWVQRRGRSHRKPPGMGTRRTRADPSRPRLSRVTTSADPCALQRSRQRHLPPGQYRALTAAFSRGSA